MRPMRIVNQRRPARRTDKVDEMTRGLCPPAATHLGISSGKHLFDLEHTLRPLVKLTASHPCSTTGFGCCGCIWWLQELCGWQQRGQLFGTLAMVGVVAALVAGAAWLSIDEAEQRFFASAACGLPGVNSADVRRAGGRVCDRVAAHARLHVEALRTPRPAHGTVGLVL